MSKVTLAREQNKKKREEEEKKVVGQQQKTQSDSHKPTGSTSIPKDNQGINSRAQKSTAISNRTQQNTQKQTVQKRSSYNASSDRISSRAGFIEDYKKLPTANEVRHYQLPIQDRVKSDMDPMNFTPKKRTTTPVYRNGVKWGEKYISQEQKPETTTISGKEFVGSKRTGLSNTERENLERRIANVDGYRNDYNSLPQDQKDLEKQILNADRYTEDTSKSHHEERLTLGEVEKGINSVTPEILKQWVSPDTKLDEGAKQIAKGYASRELQKYNYRAGHVPEFESEEDRQNYADLVNLLNKTSGVASFSQSALAPFANIARPIANIIGDEKVKKNINENVRLAEENARVQNPGLSTAGNLAGNAGLYALTNPLFDEAAAALGVTSRAGKFIANQVGQNAQDLALDTAPTAYNLASDGNLSEEDKRELLSNVFLNAAGNLAMGGLSEAFAKPKTSIPTPEQLPKVDDITKQLPDATNLYNNIDDLLVQENLNKALGANNPLSTLKDEQILNLTKRGGDQGVLADAYNNLVRSADMENIDNFTRALDDYRQIASDNNIPGLNRPLTRLDDAINGRLMPEVTPENYGYIANNIDAIEDELNRIPEGLSDLGQQHMNTARNVLNQYEDAVRNGGDVTGLSAELNKTLANLDNQAKKLEGYDGAFSAWKGANTPRGDLYTNTGRISKPVNTEITPEERALINDWIDYDNQNRYAKPANQLTENSFENVNTPRYDENVNSVGSIGGNGNGTVNRTGNQGNIGPEEPGTILSENSGKTAQAWRLGSGNSGVSNSLLVSDEMRAKMNDIERNNMINKQPAKGAFFNGNIPDASSLPKAQKLNMNLQQFTDQPTRIPQPEDPRFGNSRVVTNTALNSDVVSLDQIMISPTVQDIMKYEKHSNIETLDNAMQRIKTEGNVWKDDYISGKKVIADDTDVDTSMLLLQDLNDKIARTNDIQKIDQYTNEKNALLRKLREAGTSGGQFIQAFAKWNNTPDGALLVADAVQDADVVKPWKSKNQKAVKGNSRIAKALADQGHKPIYKEAPVLTHEQIKQGVKAELEREMGSIEGMFNDSDLEFLTNLAENKQVPVWQITDEIEHKLNHGSWYTIDESTTPKMPTNRKLQNALNSLIEGEVRNTEPVKPDLRQISEEVRNTLKKESAELEGMFDDSDIDYLANLVNNNASREEIAEALNTKMATGRFGISAETQQKVNDLFKQAEMYDPNSKEFVECQAEAFRLLAEEIVPNATALEKFDAWRYMAMLGNPKTMLRNFVGNQMFGAVTGISNNIAAMGEAGVDKIVKAAGGEGIQRTKSVLNPVKDADLIKASSLDADASRYRQMVGSKYEKMDKDALRQSKSVFNSKLGQLAEKAVDAGISDYHAIKNKYATSLAGYLKANGYDKSIFNADSQLKRLKNLEKTQILSASEKQTMERLTKEVSELEKARDFALKQAEYATFHEDNAFADALTRSSRYLRNSDKPLLNALGAIEEGVIPFKKTPANVLKSGIEYSPLGAIDSIRQTGKLIYENTGKRAGNLAETYINDKGKEITKTLASDVINSWSKTLTGTGLTALGFYLFDKGILRDSDKETKYQDQLEGLQNYSIKINGKTYTIDWAAPAVMPLLLGAEISKVWNAQGNETSKWYEHLDEYMSAVNRIADPIVETSFLQGLSNTIETSADAVKNNDIMGIPAMIAYQAGTGYATQAIPTIGGQIARTIDPTRRSTYTDKEGVAGVLDKQGKKIMNKIPGLSMLNQPYIDTYGREQKNSPFDNDLASLGYQMFSPGYLADVNTTDADRLSRQMYEATSDEKMLPKWQSNAKIDGQRVSPEQYTDYSKAYGQANYEIRNELANDEWFNSLSDDEKAEIIGDINSIAQKVGQSAIEEDYTNASKPYEAYKQGGIDGLIEYYKDQSLNNIAKQSGYSANTKAFEEIKEALVNGDTEAAQSKIDAAQELASAGLEKPSALTTYTRAQENIPGLTVEEFTNTFKAMDSDNNQSIKQDELLEYADKNKVGQSEMEQLWKAYGNDWKSLPVLKDGKWATKSAKSATSTKTSSKASGTNTSGSTLADYRKNQKKSVASIPSAEDLPTSGNWSVSNGSKSFDLHDSKGYQKAKSAGISDSDWLNAYWAANTDKNSKITKDEAMVYIDALQGLSKADKRAWFDYLIGTRAKNPY